MKAIASYGQYAFIICHDATQQRYGGPRPSQAPDNRETPSDRHVFLPLRSWFPARLDSLRKVQAARRPVVLEITMSSPFSTCRPLHSDLTSAHLVHADADQHHQADCRVVGLNEHGDARHH
ncbi:hypothetical protein VTI28DRAFT_2896 [Corynascus sepedonium]